ncbi:MAG: SgcJ/EcaC family oxidoreductase [Steroidobacteraceae bacterium]|jgi:uncharacterized protein (TIGR02246 family)|nr:SgcJ/EcaC family oxidoreductase [Steroidobacteraceae bacterium]
MFAQNAVRFSALAALLCAPALAAAESSAPRAEQCRAVTESEIAALFDRWNAALQTREPARVVELYAERSILLPTVSNQPRRTPAERLDYFESFLKSAPRGKIDSRFVQVGCNEALDAGVYTFTFGDGSRVQARYTFTYRWDGARWLITSHHSSAMPEPVRR